MTPYVLLTEFFPPEHGGIQATLGLLVAWLGGQVTVISPQLSERQENRVVRSLFSGSTWPRWWWLVGWLRAAKKAGLTTAIFGHFSAAVIAGLVAKRFFGLRYVVLIHGQDLLSERKRWLTRFLIGPTLRQADFIGVNSAYVEKLVLAFEVPSTRIVQTHPFVKTADLLSNLETTAGHRLITVSRLVPRKNIGSLLCAVAELKKRFSDITLEIVGDGPEAEKLKAWATELNLGEAVTFHGAVGEMTKWRLLKNANVFVMAPTIRSGGADIEGLGLVYLEAAACGLPVVASNTGGVSDAVIDGQTGLLVDPNNLLALVEALEKILLNPDQAKNYGRAGRELVRSEFTAQIRITRFLTLLQGMPTEKMPLVSVIIPTYQSASTIVATLQSVQQQTYQRIEIIVVDDGSTDNLTARLEPFMKVINYQRQNNAGAPVARNKGFDRSTGKFILFLDADTGLEPTAIENMLKALVTHPQLSYVYSDFYFGWKKFSLFEYSSVKLRQRNFIHTTSLIRREAVKPFDPALKRFQDWDLWLTMDEQGQRGGWIPAALFRVTPRPGGSGISAWRPSFVYRLPLVGQGRGSEAIAKYRQAEAIIRAKHNI